MFPTTFPMFIHLPHLCGKFLSGSAIIFQHVPIAPTIFQKNNWLVVLTPLKKIRVRQLGWWHSQLIWENNQIHVPNHQPFINVTDNYTTFIQTITSRSIHAFILCFSPTCQHFPPLSHHCKPWTADTTNPIETTVAGSAASDSRQPWPVPSAQLRQSPVLGGWPWRMGWD